MRKEDNSTDLSTHFSDVWANAQISRSVVLGALVVKAWHQLFGGAAGHDDRPNVSQYLGA